MNRPRYSNVGSTMSETQARRWVRSHWRGFISNADMPDQPEARDPIIEKVWGDECRKIAERI